MTRHSVRNQGFLEEVIQPKRGVHKVNSERDRATPKRETRTAVARMEKAGVKDETARFDNRYGEAGGQTCILLFYRLLILFGVSSSPFCPTSCCICRDARTSVPMRWHTPPHSLLTCSGHEPEDWITSRGPCERERAGERLLGTISIMGGAE